MRRTMTMILVFTMLVALPGIALAAAGDLDPTFGNGGSTAPVSDYQPSDVALQSDGKIVAVGWDGLARWTSDGGLDPSFGSSGIAPVYDVGYQLIIQRRDATEYLLASHFDWLEWECCERISGGSVGVLRYTPSGALDSTFAAAVNVDGGLPLPVDLEIQPDGRIVQAINVTQTMLDTCVLWECVRDARDDSHMLVRYDAEGGLDETFGDGGIVRLEHVLGHVDVAVQADGRLVTTNVFRGGVLVRRLEADGTTDPTFRPVTILQDRQQTHDSAVAIDPDGTITVAAVACATDSYYATGCETRVHKLQSDGSPTPGFTPAEISSGPLLELEIETSGAVLLIEPQRMTRIDRSGEIDESFGSNGSVAIENLRAAEAQPDGNIVTLRATAPHSNENAMVVSRYLGSGDATEPPPPLTTGTIAGSVTTTSGTPIADAVVDCGTGGSSTSSSSGEYSIIEVAEGSYHCTASASGYRSKKQHVTVVAGETTTANFQLHPVRNP